MIVLKRTEELQYDVEAKYGVSMCNRGRRFASMVSSYFVTPEISPNGRRTVQEKGHSGRDG